MQKRSPWLDRIGLLFSLLLLAGLLVARLRLAPALTGFYLFAFGGLASVLMTLVFAVRRLRGHPLGFAGFCSSAAGILFVAALLTASGDGPQINDFTTDRQDPPAFVHARTLPPNLGREMSYPADYAAQQEECCADLAPQNFAASPAETLTAATLLAEAQPRWEVVNVNPETGTLEAVATTMFFGFQDDIVVRVAAAPSGSIVDMRSKSRDGKSDLGANAARIRVFQNQLSDQIR